MQKHKLANLLLALSPLCIYLEWGSGMHSFLIEAEARVLSGLWSHPEEALHPFVLLPLTGQVLLLATLFQQRPGFWLSAAGMVYLCGEFVRVTLSYAVIYTSVCGGFCLCHRFDVS